MHPNAFLKVHWRHQILDQVFVAMSFEDRFEARFREIIQPAIEGEALRGIRLSAYRVDNSESGDSILTDIVNGIAHSRLILADVSVIDEGRDAGRPMRNGNVMYEAGVALAARTPSEVLLIRDDSKRFLFDVSTIPHLTIDFDNTPNAIVMLRSAIMDRLDEVTLVADARVQMAADTLTADELRVLRALSRLEPDQCWTFR